MAIPKPYLDQINAAYSLFASRCKDFNPTEENKKVLCQCIARTGLPHEQWDVEHFWQAYEALNAEGVLERVPTEAERRAAIEYRLYKEGKESQRLPNHAEKSETVGEVKARVARQVVDDIREAVKANEAAKQSAEARAKSDRDCSTLPTFQQIADGASLSSQEQRALSAPQLREYIRRSQLAQNEIYRRQREGQNA